MNPDCQQLFAVAKGIWYYDFRRIAKKKFVEKRLSVENKLLLVLVLIQ